MCYMLCESYRRKPGGRLTAGVQSYIIILIDLCNKNVFSKTKYFNVIRRLKQPTSAKINYFEKGGRINEPKRNKLIQEDSKMTANTYSQALKIKSKQYLLHTSIVFHERGYKKAACITFLGHRILKSRMYSGSGTAEFEKEECSKVLRHRI